MNSQLTLRKAGISDLEEINRVIADAISLWNIPERVKRLSLPGYLYKPHDLQTIELLAAESETGDILGVAGWEPADTSDTPDGQTVLLLHGIYIKPEFQRQGIGTQLLRAAEHAACDGTYSGLLVKAHTDAVGFFKTNGMQQLTVENESRDYAHRFWKPCNQ